MFKSIKARIFLWLITSFAIIITALGFFLFSRLNTYAIDMVDHLLSHKSDLLKGLIHVDKKGELEFELSEITSGDYSIIKSGHYFELTDGRGVSIVKSKSLNDSTIVTNKEAGYHTVAGPSGEPMRLFIEEFSVNGERFFIYVAEGISKELSLLKSFKVILIFFFPLTVIVSGLGSILIVLISFRPVASFSRQIGLITEKRLHERVDSQGVDTELKGLASSFNETMDRLEKAFQAQRDFLSDASHELRTPTAVIKSTVDVTLRRERSAVEYRAALETVKAAAERMGGLIDRLLKLSRIDAEKAGVRKDKVNLKDVVKIALKTISPLAEAQEINLHTEEAEDVAVEGDREQLAELFLSILDNAIKYNRHKGSVVLSIARTGEWAVVKVTDSGVGIAPEALGKVFDRFYRADFSRGEIPGTGLGLPIAKGIAEAHGGRIEVESEAGKGSTFIVYMPVSQ